MANKKQNTKITLEEFIAKATAKHNNKKMFVDLYIDEEFGQVTFKRPSNNDILQYINNVSKSISFDKEGNMIGQDTVLMFEASKELVYISCSYLQNKELHNMLGVTDPLDVVAEVFGVQNTIDLATKIKDAFDGESIRDEIKN